MGNCCYTTATVDDQPRTTSYMTTTSNSELASYHHQTAGHSQSSPQQQVYAVTPTRGQGHLDPVFEAPPPPASEPQQLEHIADREGQGNRQVSEIL